jgi:DNA invertase Pin-like site-specific DNA recombinase
MGLVVQEKAIRAWCRAQGFRLGHVERDEGVSGTRDAAEREGLRRALEAVEAREAAGVVVYRLDRLARSLTVQEAVLAKVWRDGGRVFATDVGEVARDDPDDPMRTAMRQMFGVFSQLERSLIAARMRAGRRAKADAGGYAGFGSPPFGWQSVDGQLLVSDREVPSSGVSGNCEPTGGRCGGWRKS